jgi:hypothetical protein
MKLAAIPMDLEGANEFVSRHHRHHQPVVGHKFSIGAALGGKLVGVAIVGRPVSRHRDDGATLEVTRLCTDGTKNACSFLYGAAARARRLIDGLGLASGRGDTGPVMVRAFAPAQRQNRLDPADAV